MFCIALVLVNSAGYFIYFKAETYKAKKQFKTKLRSIENLKELPKEVIRFAIAKTAKIQPQFKDKFEFELNGQMYDIVRTSSTKDSSIYYVLTDNDETKLYAAFKNHIENERKSEHKKSANNLSFEYLLTAQIAHNLIGENIQLHFGYIQKQTILTTNKIEHPPQLIS